MKRYSTFSKSPMAKGLMSYPGHSLGESYSSAEMQLVYSTVPADWAKAGRRKVGFILCPGVLVL